MEYGFEAAWRVLAGRGEARGRDVLAEVDRTLTPAVLLACGTAALLEPTTALTLLLSLGKQQSALVKLGGALRGAAGVRVGASRGRHDRLARLEAAEVVVAFGAWLAVLPRVVSVAQEALGLDDARGALDPRSLEAAVGGAPPVTLAVASVADQPGRREARVSALFEELGRRLEANVLAALPQWEGRGAHPRVAAELDALPAAARADWREQITLLAADFPDFAAWTYLARHEELRARLGDVERGVAAVRATLEARSRSLAGLAEAVARGDARPVSHRLNRIRTGARARLAAPIIDVPVHDVPLTPPTLADGFVAPAFRVRRARGTERLEDPAFWRDTRPRRDLLAFVVAWLLSPEAARMPLLVLGAPGAGKSRLLDQLAGRLADTIVCPLPVDLAHADDARHVTDLVVSGLRRAAEGAVEWADVVDGLDPTGGGVLLADGLDELVQSGKAGAMRLLAALTELQAAGRTRVDPPLRVVVTSRAALVDQCDLPQDLLVLHIEPFDQHQRRDWIKRWNTANADAFVARGVAPLVLPPQRVAPSLYALAGQPLLLTLLALVDAEGNALVDAGRWSEARLYEELVTRFHHRERQREPAAAADLDALGVAATGMWHRGATFVRTAELDADLRHFGHGAEATRVIRGFYFVQTSGARRRGAPGDERYEFLHATLGEFLAARWLFGALARHAGASDAAWGDPLLWDALAQGPLFRHPMVLRYFAAIVGEHPEARVGLASLLVGLLERVLGEDAPPGGAPADRVGLPRRPWLERSARFSLNVALLRAMLLGGQEQWVARFPGDGDGVSGWDRLAHLWRVALPVEELSGLLGVMSAMRQPGRPPTVRRRTRLYPERFASGRARTERARAAWSALGDRHAIALMGFFTANVSTWSIETNQGLLEEVLPELQFDYAHHMGRRFRGWWPFARAEERDGLVAALDEADRLRARAREVLSQPPQRNRFRRFGLAQALAAMLDAGLVWFEDGRIHGSREDASLAGQLWFAAAEAGVVDRSPALAARVDWHERVCVLHDPAPSEE